MVAQAGCRGVEALGTMGAGVGLKVGAQPGWPPGTITDPGNVRAKPPASSRGACFRGGSSPSCPGRSGNRGDRWSWMASKPSVISAAPAVRLEARFNSRPKKAWEGCLYERGRLLILQGSLAICELPFGGCRCSEPSGGCPSKGQQISRPVRWVEQLSVRVVGSWPVIRATSHLVYRSIFTTGQRGPAARTVRPGGSGC